MKTLTPSSKKHVLKTLCSLLLLLAMLPGVLAQEPLPDERSDILDKDKINAVHDKSTPIMLNVVGGGARIHGLTVGRGGGNKDTNSAFGLSALYNNTSGSWNTAIGYASLYYNTSGSSNTAIGRNALYFNTTAPGNTAIGMAALFRNTTGYHNNALGLYALTDNTTGYYNTALGSHALSKNTTGNRNTAIGSQALFSNTTASQNIAIGYQALYKNMYYNLNLAIGNTALYNMIYGGGNTAIGHSSLYELENGDQNTSVGYRAMYGIKVGTNNTAIGYHSGYENSLYTSMSTFIGSNARPYASGDITGEFYNVTCIGYNTRASDYRNQVRIGNTAVTSIGGYASWTTLSDGNYKSNVTEDAAGLEFILQLRPVSYNLDVHKLAADLEEDVSFDEEGNKTMSAPDETTLKSRDEKSAIRFAGFIAQEVEATVKELGVAFSGVDAPSNKSGHYGLRYADFVVPLVRAVQEQQAQIELLEPAAVEALRIELQGSRAENAAMQQELKEVKDKLDQLLALLKQQGVDLGRMNTNDPSRTGPDQSWSSNEGSSARLEQNTPNPFHENTLIRYFLPEGTHRAQIIITDMAGLQVMSLPLGTPGCRTSS
jgi:trimeric autotransporter adhesin